MIKKDWKKQLKRVRDIADKNFNRNEKPEQLNDNLTKLESQIDDIKHVCQSIGKKVLGCLQLHGVEQDKRSKKLPESALSRQLIESSNELHEHDALRKTLMLCGRVEDHLAYRLTMYEDEIESKVLGPIQMILEKDIPNIVKLRKQMMKQAQEFETLRSRHTAMSRQSMAASEVGKKLSQAHDDMEDAGMKLDLYKDQLATEMYNFKVKAGELNKIFIALIDSQLKYHAEASSELEKVLPELKTIEETVQQPVFGCPLELHLRQTNKEIAVVIEQCVTALVSEGIELEGLFRVAGGTTKLRKLKAAFDAGMVDMEEYITDPHCVASALKLYLRELPEPLMTFELYDDWAEAAQLPGEQRVNAISNILKKMRKQHYENLKYFIQFLSKLAANSELNKMSPSNLAIVVGPSLLWSSTVDSQQQMLTTGVQSAITETMISNAPFLFGDDSEVGTMPSDTNSSSQASISTSSREVSSSHGTKQTMSKFDSSDSLSSDSLGAENTTATVVSGISNADTSTAIKNVPDADVANLVPPKRAVKKSHAPMPPNADATLSIEKTAHTPLTAKRPLTTSGDIGQPPATVGVAGNRPHSMPGDVEGVSEAKITTSAQPVVDSDSAVLMKTSASADQQEFGNQKKVQQGVAGESDSSRGVVLPGEEKQRQAQFAANKALLSKAFVSGPPRTFLTRPNMTYMDQAKLELMKTAEEHNDEIGATKSDVNGTERSDGDTDVKTHSSPTGNVESSDEVRTTAATTVVKPQEEQPKRKPERPSKPVRQVSEADTGGNGLKIAPPEEHLSKDSKPSSASNQQSANEHAVDSSSHNAVHSKSTPPDAPETVPHQSSGGIRPPKPPLPAVLSSRLPSSGHVDENTYL